MTGVEESSSQSFYLFSAPVKIPWANNEQNMKKTYFASQTACK